VVERVVEGGLVGGLQVSLNTSKASSSSDLPCTFSSARVNSTSPFDLMDI
jgi:hypothetical protein